MPQALQCPRCNGAVSVPDHAAGQRVNCPHCDQAFLAPGAAAANEPDDDDDWLVLDSDPIDTGLPDVPPAPIKAAPGPNLTSKDENSLDEFTSDFDEFTAEAESPPPAAAATDAVVGAPVTPADDDDLFGDLPEMDLGLPAPGAPGPSTESAFPTPQAFRSATPPPVQAATPQPPRPTDATSAQAPVAHSVEYETEYRVKCSICGSILYAKAEQAGKTVKCSDCHSAVPIPQPPRKKKRAEIDIERAETFALETTDVAERRDPFQKSADELLDAASRVEEESTPDYDDVPSVKEWAKNVFGVFLDPGVLVHWLGLSTMAAIPAFIVLSVDVPALIVALFPAGFILGAIVVACGFAILQSVANEEESVSDWPVFDPLAWFGQLFVAVAAATVAAVPAWALSVAIFGPSLMSVAITMLSVYAFFPFVLLSMLDMNSAFIPFSPEVARSVTKCEESWGGFYFSSGLLFVGLFLLFAVTSGSVGAVMAIFACIGIAFTYFSMIGRLAYAIGQAVNAPPMKNDVDRTRKSRSHDGSV